jgi:hypothetical protein
MSHFPAKVHITSHIGGRRGVQVQPVGSHAVWLSLHNGRGLNGGAGNMLAELTNEQAIAIAHALLIQALRPEPPKPPARDNPLLRPVLRRETTPLVASVASAR